MAPERMSKPGTRPASTNRASADQAAIVGPAGSPTQAIGALAEELAARHLQAQGLRLLARNVRCRGGEIDLVCVDPARTIIFVEVRLRRNPRFSSAAESITRRKQQRIILAARWWLQGAGRRHAHAPCRFDAVLLDDLDPSRLHWLQGAFDADDC